MELFYQVIPTKLGDCFCCADSNFLIYLNFIDSKHSVDECIASVCRLYPDGKIKQGDVAFKKEVVSACSGKIGSDVPVKLEGTPFSKIVWEELKKIPFGEVITYSELANRIGKPTATRAVASACGRNPVPIFVPCHRVVGKNGKLTGFGCGIDRKKTLLGYEGQVFEC